MGTEAGCRPEVGLLVTTSCEPVAGEAQRLQRLRDILPPTWRHCGDSFLPHFHGFAFIIRNRPRNPAPSGNQKTPASWSDRFPRDKLYTAVKGTIPWWGQGENQGGLWPRRPHGWTRQPPVGTSGRGEVKPFVTSSQFPQGTPPALGPTHRSSLGGQ